MGFFIMQYIYRNRYLVVIVGDVYVYKYEKGKFNQPFLSYHAKKTFIGESSVCEITELSGAADYNSDFDGNSILPECQDNENVYISGLESSNFNTNDKLIDYISLMGNNMSPYTFAIGENYPYFVSTRYKYFENDKIEEATLLNATIASLDRFDFHLGKCGVDFFQNVRAYSNTYLLAT